jgi:hypothetical protein
MDNLAIAPLTMCMSKAGLAAGTTVTISTVNAVVTNIQYSIAGLLYAVAVGANQSIAGALDVNTGAAFVGVAKNQGTVFVACYNAAGTLSFAQGSVEALDTAGNFFVAPRWPVVPDTYCPIGYLVLKCASTYVANPLWTLGTATGTLAATTGCTFAFGDLATIPGRPRVS